MKPRSNGWYEVTNVDWRDKDMYVHDMCFVFSVVPLPRVAEIVLTYERRRFRTHL